MFNQKAMSTREKSHTTFPESLKRGLKDLMRNTLPFRINIIYYCNMRYLDIKERKFNIVNDFQSKDHVNSSKVLYHLPRISEKGV